MPFDKEIADRVRHALRGVDAVTEKKMFGGLAFMVDGHMCCGVVRDDLMVRVGADQYAECLGRPGAREMDFTGRPLRGFVFVSPVGLSSEERLQDWVERGLRYVSSLPAKGIKGSTP